MNKKEDGNLVISEFTLLIYFFLLCALKHFQPGGNIFALLICLIHFGARSGGDQSKKINQKKICFDFHENRVFCKFFSHTHFSPTLQNEKQLNFDSAENVSRQCLRQQMSAPNKCLQKIPGI